MRAKTLNRIEWALAVVLACALPVVALLAVLWGFNAFGQTSTCGTGKICRSAQFLPEVGSGVAVGVRAGAQVCLDYPTNSVCLANSGAGNAYVLKAGDTMTGALVLPDGTAGTPSLGVGTSLQGFYRAAGNDIGVAIAGSKVADFLASGVSTNGSVTAASLVPSGSSAPTNGLYLPAANSPSISVNSTETVRFPATRGTGGALYTSGGAGAQDTWTSVLGYAAGGTAQSANPQAGMVAIGVGGAFGFTAVGTTGQYLQSAGAATPVWVTSPGEVTPCAWKSSSAQAINTPFGAWSAERASVGGGDFTMTIGTAGTGGGNLTLQVYNLTGTVSVCTCTIACAATVNTSVTCACDPGTGIGVGRQMQMRVSTDGCTLQPVGNVCYSYKE